MPDARSVHHVSLSLTRLEELVVPPETEPLAGRFEERTGVERILDSARARYTRRLDAIAATLAVDEQPDAEALRRIDGALKALRDHQERRLGEQLVTIRRDGLRALGKGVAFVLVCMVISAVVGKVTVLPDVVRSLVSEGFVIAGWVALWVPMELLLYDWWPVTRDRKLYRLIAEMEITLKPTPGAGSPPAG